MTANPILLQKKYSRVIECFAKQQGLSLDAALDFFYHSEVYQLIRDGISDMHCMSPICSLPPHSSPVLPVLLFQW